MFEGVSTEGGGRGGDAGIPDWGLISVVAFGRSESDREFRVWSVLWVSVAEDCVHSVAGFKQINGVVAGQDNATVIDQARNGPRLQQDCAIYIE
jgi:hypothetical protein